MPCLSPRDLPDPENEPRSPALQADSLPAEPRGKTEALGDRRHVWTYFKNTSAVSGWRVRLEAESFPCRHQHGEFEPSPVLSAQMPKPEAEEAALGAHAVGHNGRYTLVVVSYLLITGGMLYDVAVEPPSVGSVTDDHRHQRPVTSWPKWTVYHGRTCIQLPV